MKAFLKTVAQDMLAKYGTNMSDIAVVFPNKRAALFLNTLCRSQIDLIGSATFRSECRRKRSLMVVLNMYSFCVFSFKLNNYFLYWLYSYSLIGVVLYAVFKYPLLEVWREYVLNDFWMKNRYR